MTPGFAGHVRADCRIHQSNLGAIRRHPFQADSPWSPGCEVKIAVGVKGCGAIGKWEECRRSIVWSNPKKRSLGLRETPGEVDGKPVEVIRVNASELARQVQLPGAAPVSKINICLLVDNES